VRNVAVVTTSYPAFTDDPSGHFVQTEARILARDASVVVITAGPTATREQGDDGILVMRLAGGSAFGWPGITARLRESPMRALRLVRWTRRAREALRSLGPLDRVVAHWAVPCGLPVSDDIGVPLEVVSHGGDVRLLIRLPAIARHAAVVRLLDQVTLWRFVSESLREELASSLQPIERARLLAVSTVAPAAMSLPEVRARASVLRDEALGESGARLFVCAGRLVAGKSFDRALEYVAREGRTGSAARVVIVGDGPERPRLEALAHALGLDARFVGMTPRPDALAWIAAADALLHASRAEGLSTVVREAGELGTRVVLVG